MNSNRTVTAAAIGAAALCVAGIVTAGAVQASAEVVSVVNCGDSPSSWADGSATFTGVAVDGSGQGFPTELTVQKRFDDASQSSILTVTGASARWHEDPARAADSFFYDTAPLGLSGRGTYYAETKGHSRTFGQPVATTFVVVPRCAADGTVESLVSTIYMRDRSALSANLKRGPESGSNELGRADGSPR